MPALSCVEPSAKLPFVGGSQREDYVLRQIRVIAAMLARVAGLRLDSSMEEAKTELERAYGALLGPETHLIRRMDPATAASLVGSSERIYLLARMASEEAALETDPARISALRRRAVELGREALRRDPGHEEAQAFLERQAQGGSKDS